MILKKRGDYYNKYITNTILLKMIYNNQLPVFNGLITHLLSKKNTKHSRETKQSQLPKNVR